MANTRQSNHSQRNAAVGIGALAAAAAAAAGAYYFYGKNGPRHRKQLKGWAVKAQGEVMERLEELKDVTRDSYEKTVNDVMSQYKTLKKASPAELASVAKELKGHWNAVSRQINEMSGKSRGTAPKRTGNRTRKTTKRKTSK